MADQGRSDLYVISPMSHCMLIIKTIHNYYWVRIGLKSDADTK